MPRRIQLIVARPYHGADGQVLYEPGQMFLLSDLAGLPDDLRVRDVIFDDVDGIIAASSDEQVVTRRTQ